MLGLRLGLRRRLGRRRRRRLRLRLGRRRRHLGPALEAQGGKVEGDGEQSKGARQLLGRVRVKGER